MMRTYMRLLNIAASALVLSALFAAPRAGAQSPADGRLLAARRVLPTVVFKIWNPAGHIRLVAWNRDSVVVRGRVAKHENFFFAGDSEGVKLGIERHWTTGNAASSDFVVYLPSRGRVSVKTVSASIE